MVLIYCLDADRRVEALGDMWALLEIMGPCWEI